LALVSDNPPTVGRAGLDMLLASARREVLIISGSGNARFGRLDHENLRRGVRYRVLFPDAARLSGQLNQLSLAGAEVRTEAEVPMEGMVIDGVAAVLPADRAGAAVFRLPGVVASTVGLFERIWPGAAPLIPADPDAVGPGLTSRERALLDLLCSGATDESAGARLGISVRTVRRMVADIMNRLGARSRFQAGMKLADRGWLLDKAG
jgi:DNA-binding CsgD family transcriptional regulator